MENLASIVISNMRSLGFPEYPTYEAVLNDAVVSAPPPFALNSFGRRYFELARHADWFANSLVANAALEGYGARQIWKFANRVGDDTYAAAVRKHAMDESRHSTMFVAMLGMVFPGATVDESTDQSLESLQPRFALGTPPVSKRPEGELYCGNSLLNELIQVHITEIRALVLQYLLRSVVLAYAPATQEHRLARMSSCLIRDETRHIEYTARIFETEASRGAKEYLFDSFAARLRDFNDLTLVELERENIVL